VVVALLTTLLAATPALAVDEVDTKRLRDAVTVNGILAHERVFQRIANQNGGTRASGTPGYDASAAYVQRRLEAAGYEVSAQEFTFPFYQELTRRCWSRSRRRRPSTSPAPMTSPAPATSPARCSPPTTS